jgi:hypothetical protein
LMLPGDTVLNRMLFAAYSSANALLTAGIGDFDSGVREAARDRDIHLFLLVAGWEPTWD